MHAPRIDVSSDESETRKLVKPMLGVAACYLLAFVSLGIAVHETRALLALLEHGERANAVVVGIHVGVKGGKKAMFEFETESGERVTSRDLFQMYLVRHEVGDAVVALYESRDPQVATIDIGPWMWQEPGLLYFAFAFLAGLGVLLLRAERRAAT